MHPAPAKHIAWTVLINFFFTNTGEFGIVYKANLTNWNEIELQKVAVKTLKGDQCMECKLIIKTTLYCTEDSVSYNSYS